MDTDNLTIGEIDQGNLVLQANKAIREMIQDIGNPNKIAAKKREVVIKIGIAPNKTRREAEVTYLVTSKPSTHIDRSSTIYLAQNPSGETIAKPWIPNQQNMPFDEDLPENNVNSADASVN